MSQQGSTGHDQRDYAGCISCAYAVGTLLSLFFLLVNAMLAYWSTQLTSTPLSIWHALLLLLICANVSLFLLPVIIHRVFKGRDYGRQAFNWVVLVLLVVIALNLFISRAIWGFVCGYCYFG